MNPILTISQLEVSIGGKRICHGLEWEVQPGEVWGILGLNGVGKSTLLHTLAGLHAADSGTLSLNGSLLSAMSRREISRVVGMLFQHQDDIFPATVLDIVLMGRHPHTTILQGEQESDYLITERVLGEMGLAGMEERKINTLSGGERRRVAIATVLAQQPQLFLLDEPEAHLDPKHQREIFHRVTKTVDGSCALVMALHDINLAIHYCSHLLLMLESGEIRMGRVEEIITQSQVEELYGTAMARVEEGGRVAYLPL